MRPEIAPIGFCQCGCGDKTKLALKTQTSRKIFKGKPLKFVKGHGNRYGNHRFEIDSKGCWIFQGTKYKGYGKISRDGKDQFAHRYYYQKYRGPLISGMVLDHLCRNPSCVNPFHLDQVPHAVNCQRGKNTKISPEVALEIKRLLKNGLRVCEVSNIFKTSYATVWGIKAGLKWKAVQPKKVMEKKIMTLFDKMFQDSHAPEWMKNAALEAIKREPMTAANEAQFLAAALWERAKEMLSEEIGKN